MAIFIVYKTDQIDVGASVPFGVASNDFMWSVIRIDLKRFQATNPHCVDTNESWLFGSLPIYFSFVIGYNETDNGVTMQGRIWVFSEIDEVVFFGISDQKVSLFNKTLDLLLWHGILRRLQPHYLVLPYQPLRYANLLFALANLPRSMNFASIKAFCR